jgi:uncharacterized protein (TIGR03663 family)
MNKKAFAGLFLLIVLLGAGLRLTGLGLRPMHHDEANQALKFGALLDRGEYRYDKSDHHGPSLYYLSLPFARVSGAGSLAALSEETLRLVPAFFGIGTILLLLLFIPLVGRKPVLWAALGLAISPVMVYFSRFYIQETLLLFFLAGFIGSLWRYRRRPSLAGAAAAGFFAGMMYATKETSVIAFGSAAVSFLLISVIRGKNSEGRGVRVEARVKRSIWIDALIGFAAAAAVSILLFTSFFQNPGGWLDSILSYRVYFVRAGEAGFHGQPWPYYLRLLAYSKSGSGPVWSEGLILFLAAAGIAAAFWPASRLRADRQFLRFVVFYTLISTAAYSLVPYKTPWNVLPFYLGVVLLAGAGAAAYLGVFRNKPARLFVLVLLAAGFSHLGAQAWRAGFAYAADTRNPYVYAQTSPGFLKLVRRVEDLAAVHPDHDRMLIKVIAGPYETWPLPWYLRRFGRVGYWQDAASAGPPSDAAVVIAEAQQAGTLEPSLNASFPSEFYELRPNVFLVLYVRADLWEKYLSSRSGK